jgi:Uma2 family endonuclease
MEQPAPRHMTVAEFLAWDDGTDTGYELARGVPVAMNPPLARHAVISGNLFRILDVRLRPPCRVWFGAGIAAEDEGDEYRIPDLFVACGPPGKWYFAEPRLIVEVLSPSTEKDDRTAKLDFYRSLPSVEAVLLVWQDARRIELHARAGDIWQVRSVIGGGAVDLVALAVTLPLDEIYAEA